MTVCNRKYVILIGHVSLCNAHLIHNHHLNFIHFGYALFYQVQNSARCCYYNMNCRKEYAQNAFTAEDDHTVISLQWLGTFYVITEHYPSHPGAWYHLEGWSPLWLPWLWHHPGACWSEYWSDWPAELVHEWEPSRWLQANKKIAQLKKKKKGIKKKRYILCKMFWERKQYPGYNPFSCQFSLAGGSGMHHSFLSHFWHEPVYRVQRGQ